VPARLRAALLIVLAGLGLTVALDLLLPPDLSRYTQRSTVVTAADGTPLRAYLTADGAMRWASDPAQVSPAYLRLLIAYEDQRFRTHPGVDPWAMGRALGQAVRAGRIVSGGSTLTMQVARLLEPRPRTVGAKLIEMARALQLERRFSKDEILGMYLTLAPFGGPVEGIAAASQLYLARAPSQITLAQAAMLVALPQSPTRLKADPAALTAARAKVLRIAGRRAGLAPADIAAALRTPVPALALTLPFRAPHLADRLRAATRAADRIATTLDAGVQATLERQARGWARTLDPRASLAVLVVRLSDGAVLGYLGSADFRDAGRAGQVDAVQAVRSPGSTLKPLIYAAAFDRGLAHPLSLVDDVETRFGSYAPANFEDSYHGRVTLVDGLRLSLNVPAVLLLDRLGPVAFVEGLRRHGLDLALPEGVTPGLPVALGGVGVRLDGLAAAYRALATDGIIRPLRFKAKVPLAGGEAFVRPQARLWVRDILSGAPAPDGVVAASPGIAVKTGTSYGYRDAWALGWDARHLVAVWTGRPDGTSSPGRFGIATAAPILFDVFGQMGVQPLPQVVSPGLDSPVPEPVRLISADAGRSGRALRVLFPVDGATVPLRTGATVPLDVRGGRAPYTWLVNGAPLGTVRPGEALGWQPDGPGTHQLTVIDSDGRAAHARVQVAALTLDGGATAPE
jgi:penicillin-binding protein 1C